MIRRKRLLIIPLLLVYYLFLMASARWKSMVMKHEVNYAAYNKLHLANINATSTSSELSTLSLLAAENCPDSFNKWFSFRYPLTDELHYYMLNNCLNKSTHACKKGALLSAQVQVHLSKTTLAKLSEQYPNSELSFPGGWWSPENCVPRRHVAVIIAFRNREDNLPVFLRHFLPILRRIGDIHFRVFLIEQIDSYSFNKGKLYNIGFVESQKYFPYDCYIFHDIDLLAENDNIPVACEESPMHLSVAIDRYRYKLLYRSLVGGVLMMSPENYTNVNGFTNSIWYWGGEDDNMYARLKRKGLVVKRPPETIARYKHVPHIRRSKIEGKRSTFLYKKEANKYFDTDGLNHLQYKLLGIKDDAFFTHIQVDMEKEKDRRFGILEYFTNATAH